MNMARYQIHMDIFPFLKKLGKFSVKLVVL